MPNVVSLMVPENGFGRTLDAIFAFHRERGLEPMRGRGARNADQDYARWCFASAADAEAFAAAFRGQILPGGPDVPR